jgi:hypothetical protein
MMIKRLLFFSFCVVLIGCKSKTSTPKKPSEEIKPEYIQLAIADVGSLQKNRAYELGKRVLMTCNTSKFKPFTKEEATPEVLNNITIEKLSKTCQNVIRGFDKFNDIKLIEVLRFEEEKITLFRYKCDYEKKYYTKELRVSVNDENKITSIKTEDWKDSFQ